MPEAQTYTTYRDWPIVRKASSVSESRDWYAEHTTFANAIDADVNKLIPADRRIIVAPSGTDAANGTALLAAITDAKALSPTIDKPVAVYLPNGQYDLGTSALDLDTDYLYLVGESPAHRSQWVDTPVWTDVEIAGTQIYSSYAGYVITVTAWRTLLMNIHTELTGASIDAYPSVLLAPAGTAQDVGPTLIGCSFGDRGLQANVSAAYSVDNCHSKGGLFDHVDGVTADIAGIVVGSSACNRASFFTAGTAAPLLVENCLIKHGATVDTVVLDEAVFRRCRFFGTTAVFGSDDSAASDTENTVFENCYINTPQMIYASDDTRECNSQFLNCDIIMDGDGLCLGTSGYIEGGRIERIDSDNAPIFVSEDGIKGINGTRIIKTAAPPT